MGQSQLIPKRGLPQLNDLVQHAAENSCSNHCEDEWLSNKHITTTDKSESIKNTTKVAL